MKNQDLPQKIISFIEMICIEQNALIYGGASLIIRSYLNQTEHYRHSTDVDLKRINNSNTGKKIGPRSQFKPYDIEKSINEWFGEDFEIEVIKNNKSSKNLNYRLIFPEKIAMQFNLPTLNFELRYEEKVDDDTWEMIDDFRLIKLSKIFSDKLFATLEMFEMGKLRENNLIRHLVDLMLIPSEYKLNSEFTVEFMKFFKDRIDEESEYVKRNKNDFEVNMNLTSKSVVIKNPLAVWENMSIEILYDEDGGLDAINEELNSNDRYKYDGDIFTEKRINFIRELLKEYEV